MYVYRKNFVFLHECMSASVGNTIIRDLPRLHDIEAISRDSCHGAQARWYRGSYEASYNDSTRR